MAPISWPDHLLYPCFPGFLRTWLTVAEISTSGHTDNWRECPPKVGSQSLLGADGHGGLAQLGYSGYSASKGVPTPLCQSGHPLAVERVTAYGSIVVRLPSMCVSGWSGIRRAWKNTYVKALGDPWKQVQILCVSWASVNQKGYQLWGLKGPTCVS